MSAPGYAPAERSGGDGNVVTRRRLIAAGGAFLVSGCTMPPVIGNAINAARTVVTGAPDVPISPEYVANLPYASMAAKIGRGPRSIVVLGKYDGADLHWISADNAVVVTRNGRITKTAGIGKDLLGTQGIEDDPVAAATFAFEGIHTRTVDVTDPGAIYGIPIESTFEVVDRETIQILDRERDTIKVFESNTAMTVRWRFRNEFWLISSRGFFGNRSSISFATPHPSKRKFSSRPGKFQNQKGCRPSLERHPFWNSNLVRRRSGRRRRTR